MAKERVIKLTNDGKRKAQSGIEKSTGTGDAGKFVVTTSTGRLDESIMPVGFGDEVKILEATEPITAGKYVNIYNVAGVGKIRNADASTGKKADGFIVEGVAIGATVKVFTEGINNALTGLTPGADYYLSSTNPGEATTIPPTSTGNILQRIGKALSVKEMNFESSEIIEIA